MELIVISVISQLYALIISWRKVTGWPKYCIILGIILQVVWIVFAFFYQELYEEIETMRKSLSP